jgi:hypothetical protein
VYNNGSVNADSKDLFFNPFKRKSSRSASIYPQQARISMHSHQAPTGLSDEFSPDSDNWKQVSSKSEEDSLFYMSKSDSNLFQIDRPPSMLFS